MTATSIAADPLPELGNDEILRYSRHLILPEVGLEAQRKLKASSVLVVGAGGLGSPLGAVPRGGGRRPARPRRLRRRRRHQPAAPDHPRHRRRRPPEARLGARPASRSSTRTCTSRPTRPGSPRRTRSRSRADYDLVIDGTDNFPTRYLVNDACVLLGQAERVRQHLPLRGPGVGVRDATPGRATAACSAIRRRRDWCRAAPRAACWACCRD